MLSLKSLISLSFTLLALGSASPISIIKRQSSTTCGSNHYTASQVSAAANAAVGYVESGDEAGGSTYPHQYKDYEGFDFGGVQGPYYEFPIEESGVYDGGSPGADRVIVTEDGEYAGAITHTGASGDDFVGCSGTS